MPVNAGSVTLSAAARRVLVSCFQHFFFPGPTYPLQRLHPVSNVSTFHLPRLNLGTYRRVAARLEDSLTGLGGERLCACNHAICAVYNTSSAGECHKGGVLVWEYGLGAKGWDWMPHFCLIFPPLRKEMAMKKACKTRCSERVTYAEGSALKDLKLLRPPVEMNAGNFLSILLTHFPSRPGGNAGGGCGVGDTIGTKTPGCPGTGAAQPTRSEPDSGPPTAPLSVQSCNLLSASTSTTSNGRMSESCFVSS